MLDDILFFAAETLVDDGRLAFWMPTANDEALHAQDKADIEGAWAGGESGMEITDKILDNLKVGMNQSLERTGKTLTSN